MRSEDYPDCDQRVLILSYRSRVVSKFWGISCLGSHAWTLTDHFWPLYFYERMHRALSSRWLRSALSIGDRAVLTELPGFLCPALSLSAHRTAGLVTRSRSLPYRTQQRCLHVRTEESERLEEHGTAEEHDATNEGSSSRALPLQCHGCGAFSQTSEPEVAGYYDMNRKAVKKFTSMDEDSTPALKTPEEDFVVDQALKGVDEEKLAELGIDPKTLHHGDELDPHATCE